jgi:hypothetical protein
MRAEHSVEQNSRSDAYKLIHGVIDKDKESWMPFPTLAIGKTPPSATALVGIVGIHELGYHVLF